MRTELAAQTDLPQRKAEEIVDMFFSTMSHAIIAERRIEIRGFGPFVVKDYEAYTGRNPQNGARITVEPKKLPFFKVGKDLKQKIDGGGE